MSGYGNANEEAANRMIMSYFGLSTLNFELPV